MTRDDIIRLAQEVWSAGDVYIGPSTESLERFAALVAAAEREACAKICDGWASYGVPAVAAAAQAIRARGET